MYVYTHVNMYLRLCVCALRSPSIHMFLHFATKASRTLAVRRLPSALSCSQHKSIM